MSIDEDNFNPDSWGYLILRSVWYISYYIYSCDVIFW